MRLLIIFLLCIICTIVLVGCQEVLTPDSTVLQKALDTTITTPSPAATISLPQAVIPSLVSSTSTSTVTPAEVAFSTETMVPTTTPSSEIQLQTQCLDNAHIPADEINSSGFIVLEGRVSLGDRYRRETYLFNMEMGINRQILGENEGQLEHTVSPDKKMMAYDRIIFDAVGNITQEELVIANALGQPLKAISWEDGWFGIAGWLDNERLVLNIASQDPDESHARKAASLLILNPLTGERQVLRPDFPDIYDYYPIPDWDSWGITMYDPTLTRVVYLRIDEHGEYVYSLWDMEKQQLLTSLAYDAQIPRWSPDGSWVLIDGRPNDQSSAPGGPDQYATYLVSRDGKVEQLTRLHSDGNKILLSYSWSPDGRFIAAWLGDPTLYENREVDLSIVDINSRKVTNLCVRVKYGGNGYGDIFPQAPIWSPDGKQLVVKDWYEVDHRRVILVDLEKGFATQIAEDMEPMGWMLSP